MPPVAVTKFGCAELDDFIFGIIRLFVLYAIMQAINSL